MNRPWQGLNSILLYALYGPAVASWALTCVTGRAYFRTAERAFGRDLSGLSWSWLGFTLTWRGGR